MEHPYPPSGSSRPWGQSSTGDTIGEADSPGLFVTPEGSSDSDDAHGSPTSSFMAVDEPGGNNEDVYSSNEAASDEPVSDFRFHADLKANKPGSQKKWCYSMTHPSDETGGQRTEDIATGTPDMVKFLHGIAGKEHKQTKRRVETVLKGAVNGSVDIQASYNDDGWSFNPPTAQLARPKTQEYKSYLKKKLSDGLYGIVGTQASLSAKRPLEEEGRENATKLSIDILDMRSEQHESMCKTLLTSEAQLERELRGSSAGATTAPTRATLRGLFEYSNHGIYSRQGGYWAIFSKSKVNGHTRRFGPKHAKGQVVEEDDVPEDVKQALQWMSQERKPPIQHTWYIEKTQVNGGSRHETWEYTVTDAQRRVEAQFEGAQNLHAGLADLARSYGIEEGPTLSECQ